MLAIVQQKWRRRRRRIACRSIAAIGIAVLLQLFSLVSATRQSLELLSGGMELSSAIGSRPPTCEHRCGGCSPCEATQVPTTTDHMGVHQYANYEPEGWKCKCGSSLFDP